MMHSSRLAIARCVASAMAVLLSFEPLSLASAAGENVVTEPGGKKEFAYANRLIDSNDPYLLLHAHNPVDWYPWGPEALARAKSENKPIFLSVGYSTCYWCHVAERMIYAKPEFAELMNAWFVNIKVDREQRPDLDRIYMLATQVLTGRGGWPNNLFLTPELKPFFAGSYFPPQEDEFGRAGFSTILRRVHETWVKEPKRLTDVADRVHAVLQDYQRQAAGGAPRLLDPDAWLAVAVKSLAQRADKDNGGLVAGGNTKFPQTPMLELLLASYRIRRDAATLELLTGALDAMAYGGIHDHLGGGFHRYSVEPSWSVPHFEKMLYDNAQLLKIYAEAFAVTKNPLYEGVAIDIAGYLTRQMTAPGGGFYTAEDAEVGGREGASYTWSRPQIVSILGAQAAARFFDVYGLTPLAASPVAQGLEPKKAAEEESVIRIRLPIARTLERARQAGVVKMLAALQPARELLLHARSRRPQPLRDEKIIAGQNGLAIEAFVEAATVLKRQEYLEIAERAGERVWRLAYDSKSGALMHEVFKGKAQTDGYLDDYALLGRASLALHGATKQALWLERAKSLGEALLKRFTRPDGSVRMSTSAQDLLIAPIDDGDNTYPSGTSAGVGFLLRLGAAAAKPQYTDAAAKIAQRLSARLESEPQSWSTMLVALNAAKFDHSIEAPGALSSASARGSEPGQFKPPSTADHVTLDALVSAAGAEYARIAITLNIDPGYHVNANPASFAYLIPTSVSLEGITPLSVDYPQPILFKPSSLPEGIKVYEGRPTLTLTIAAKDLQNKTALRARITAQACDAEVCLPPSEIPIVIKVPNGR